MNALDDGRKIEFVCAICLHAVYALDTDPIPRCPRCLIRMLPDSDEPRTRPPQAVIGRARGRPLPSG